MVAESQTKNWIKPTKGHIYHRQTLVGTVTNICVEDMFWWSGDIELTPEARNYQVMFDYLNAEERQREPEEPDESELPFDESLMDDWSLEDENGRREIMFPRVTEEGLAIWRD
jgi:hypothetical protein